MGAGSDIWHMQEVIPVNPLVSSPRAQQRPRMAEPQSQTRKGLLCCLLHLREGDGVPHQAVLTVQPPGGRTALRPALERPHCQLESLRFWEGDGQIPNRSPAPTPDLVPHSYYLHVASGSYVFSLPCLFGECQKYKRLFENVSKKCTALPPTE